jgi:uncharacterized protein YhaN
LLAIANHWLEQTRRNRAEIDAQTKQREIDLQDYQSQVENHNQLCSRFTDLQERWWSSLATLALPKDATPEQTNIVLGQVFELQQLSDEADSIRRNIDSHQMLIDQYEQDVLALAKHPLAGLSTTQPIKAQPTTDQPTDLPPDTQRLVRSLELTKSQADKMKTQRIGLLNQVQKLQTRLEEVVCQQNELEHDLAQMMQSAETTTEESLVEVARKARSLHQLATQLNSLRDLLYKSCDNQDIDAFIEKIRSLNPDELALDKRQNEEDIESLQRQSDEALQNYTKLTEQQRQFDTSGRASYLATEALGVAAEIEECVHELAVLRLASTALLAGIEKYRQANEDPILKRASDLFRNLTLDRYQGIEIEIDEAGKHILVGRRCNPDAEQNNPTRVAIEQMSDGTRDQFFLALRLASIEQWNAAHEPMPLIVDDILVHFDDQRSTATLKQLAVLSNQTQVVFFTHHKHLIELANAAIEPERLFVHQL